ncbi:MAG: hypothetical protein QM703_27295 [Gemmatales bacterium]
MSVAMHNGLNGRFKKSLAHQLDRLDTILDGLADALNGAVSDAVRQAVLQATREAVQVAMAEVLPKPTNAETPKENPLKRLLAKVKNAFHRVQTWGAKAMQKLRRCTGTTVSAAQSAMVPWRIPSHPHGHAAGIGRIVCDGLIPERLQEDLVGSGHHALHDAPGELSRHLGNADAGRKCDLLAEATAR